MENWNIGTPRAAAIGIVLATCSAAASHAAIIYVDDTAVGTGDGTSWANAYAKLRPALNKAKAGDEVRIGQGVYCPANPGGSRSLSFVLPAGASVVGGFAGEGAEDPDAFDPQTYVTILTGDINGDDDADFANNADNCIHVVTATAGNRSTVLRGVTVTAGNADGSADPFSFDSVGGGVLLADGASPSILDCVFELNQATYAGAAIHAPKASPLVRRCIIQNNQNTLENSEGGGAVFGIGSFVQRCEFLDNVTGKAGGAVSGSGIKFADSLFNGNQAGESGGAITGNNLDIGDCTFTDNSAIAGGALRCSDTTIKNSDFDTNNATNRGGAICSNASDSTLAIENCTFTLNIGGLGGAIDTRGVFTAYNCLFDRNGTGVNGYDGGAIALRGTSNVVNCTFSKNAAALWGGAISLNDGTATITNGQFTGNSANQVGGAILNDNGTLDIDNCTIVGNSCQLQNGSPGGAVRNRDHGTLRIHNSLLWLNVAAGNYSQSAQVFRETGNLVIANCNIQGWTGSLGGVNNTSSDPLFVDPAGPDTIFGTPDDDVQLQSASPARNTGDNALLPRDTLDINGDGNTNQRVPYDLSGNRRIRQSIVDRGAYEFDPNAP